MLLLLALMAFNTPKQTMGDYDAQLAMMFDSGLEECGSTQQED